MARTKQSGRNPRKMLMTIESTTNINTSITNNNNYNNIQEKKPQNEPKVKKPHKHRYRPGSVDYHRVIKDMRIRKSTELLIKRRPFERVIKEISQSLEHVTVNLRFQKTACEALQEATEAYLTGLLMDADLLAKHAKRATLKVTDLQLAQKIRAKTPIEN